MKFLPLSIINHLTQTKLTREIPLQITLVNEQWLLRILNSEGKEESKFVSDEQLNSALNNDEEDTGWILGNYQLVRWGNQEGQRWGIIYVQPKTYTIEIEGNLQFTIPLPPFILKGKGKEYWIGVINSMTVNSQTPLFFPPTPNIHNDLKICFGNMNAPTVKTPQDLELAFKLFIDSQFNTDLSKNRCKSYPNNVLHLYESLKQKNTFPKNELIKANQTLGNLVG